MNTPNNTNCNIPFKKKDMEFIELAEPLRIPLTDMECALIDNVFLYSELVHNSSFEYEGQHYNITEKGRGHFKQIFDLLIGIVSQDTRAVEKMEEFRCLKSLNKDNTQSHTQKGVKN